MNRKDLLTKVIAAADAWSEACRTGDANGMDSAYGALMMARAALHACDRRATA